MYYYYYYYNYYYLSSVDLEVSLPCFSSPSFAKFKGDTVGV